ncbi:MAG: aminomethyl-transferring glycine dehydrogenase subunit GcvPA [Halorhodospira halophila]|uniref:aminomethyl-transferring glycine dehydrogenase subunit GcvPA n=1 Tax=Halorhodospira TaxID=85108 RepID=UPI001911FB12|nr:MULTISPECIES: aminomethyl-transferring glycine dehydrogenase subunit GcvPA [Halorhodospira]MBK5936364.1 glycine dehydrogenase (aminomethyl-transferring) [Halorhodospira halophila]MBK5943547.1 glycine dehydrogenase (aminomethyl-transferring) [Halorhodospira halophila]MCC3750149.1 aminomethyl-transferring glycine dehydrogenase subunit GcvPA [Halorhodospira halophila]MCG5527077.1 aminomethyl-transferring glycine dehydrogenase subunit GcvPA [Halorhodospira halophila]MCG5532294.1 aminomethyl-tra
MPFVPHTEQEIREMLDAIGVERIEDLFDEIPESLRKASIDAIPAGMNEMEVTQLMRRRAAQDVQPACFVGAGAYDHHVPAAVWEITTRGEFYSAYTPYQAEASQGTLQLLYEFQTMMSELTGLYASNASLYDGATALAEAVLMAVRANRKAKSKRVLMPRSVHPYYRRVVETIVANQGIELVEAPLDDTVGRIDPEALGRFEDEPFAAVVVPQPNFFGALEEVDRLTDWAHGLNALVIAVCNPVALALLTPPGEWGSEGADIACGEGQPLGIPLASGGPYFGYMTTRKQHVRQLPGRIVGRTVDADGRTGYTLTLQAREQHIRRSKATSNICTNQGLMVTAATVHLSLLGAEGLARVAAVSHERTRELVQKLTAIDGVERLFDGPFFHEVPLRIPAPAEEVLPTLAHRGVLGGYDLSQEFPEWGPALLVCATETRTSEEIDRFAAALADALRNTGQRARA